MSVFVDTSALIAVMAAADTLHGVAVRAWLDLLDGDETLITTNYVLVEVCSLLQHRFGVSYLRQFHSEGAGALSVWWVTPEQHEAALAAVLAANRRDLSLVDCTSFAVMRDLGIDQVFTLDRHFAAQGFLVVPDLTSPQHDDSR
jgi:predicted nucleic acid-binding protein